MTVQLSMGDQFIPSGFCWVFRIRHALTPRLKVPVSSRPYRTRLSCEAWHNSRHPRGLGLAVGPWNFFGPLQVCTNDVCILRGMGHFNIYQSQSSSEEEACGRFVPVCFELTLRPLVTGAWSWPLKLENISIIVVLREHHLSHFHRFHL